MADGRWHIPIVVFKSLIYRLAARAIYCRTEKKRRKNKADTGRIVIIKVDGLGDFVLFLNAFAALRSKFRDRNITLVCGTVAKNIAERCGFFDEIILYRERPFFTARGLVSQYRKYRRLKFDLLLSPSHPRALGEDMLAMMLNAKEKIASVGEAGSLPYEVKERLNGVYDRLVDTGLHNMTLIQTAVFLRDVGLGDYRATVPRIAFPIKRFLYTPENYFAVFLGGSFKSKRWDAAKYRAVADRIIEKTGWPCLVLGDGRDLEDEQAFLSNNTDARIFSFVGKTNTDEYLQLIGGARFVIGNDSSAIHIANALGVPSIAVCGCDSGEKFYPYAVEESRAGDVVPRVVRMAEKPDCYACTINFPNYRHYECIGAEEAPLTKKCIEAIPAEAVWDAFLQLYHDLEVKENG